jgi:N-acetylglucosaminyldiphosphoundecaprenol N-acetyl-beta-D-mannosaminyltransferase
MKHVRVGGVRTAVASQKDLLESLSVDCLTRRQFPEKNPVIVFDTNGHAISLYRRDKKYGEALEKADIVHADGQFIVTLSRFLAPEVVPERTATTDLIQGAAEVAVREGLSFYLLGGSESLNRETAEALTASYPGLRIGGRQNGFFEESQEDEVVSDINRSGADIVWVGLGKPKEQLFCIRNRHRIRAGWLVTCGGCFNFVTGDYRRAPRWMQASGLEWVHRMATGPAYLKQRYLLTVPHALFLCALWGFRGAFVKGDRSDTR